ncbi:hypothetical protein [Roseovarius sp. Pro17]|uniref:hypothetical protein n=1 Tax=Roseovarius sp. Pro17 TaxID=3108175 RepID=UPI002D790434|nr:hypothetical protein [Roseovarius sp. Pro17]
MNASSALRTSFDALDTVIRDHAMRKIPVARPRRMRNQLAALHDPAWDIEWQEALILLACHCRMQPARTHGKLMMLRDTRIERGEEAAFNEYMQLIRDTLHPEFITSHGYTITFSEMDAAQIFKSMGAALKPLEQLGKPFFLYAGALLGHVRNGKLIEHDDDIDIAIMLGECSEDEVAHRWLDYKNDLNKHGLIDEAEQANNRPVFKFCSDLGTEIDLFPAWTDNGKFSVYPYSLGQIDAADVFPLGTFGQDPLMLPAKPEVMLVQSYGKDWRIPDPLFHIDWKRKKNQFRKLFVADYNLRAP